MLGFDSRVARATWTVIGIALLCLVIYLIRSTLFMFVVSLLFAYLLAPLIDFIDRALPMRRSRTPALAIVYLLLVGGIIIGGSELGSRVAEQASNLSAKVSDFLKPDQAPLLALPEPVQSISTRLFSALRSFIQDHYQEFLSKIPQAAPKALGAVANLIILVIIPILSFFFLKDGRALHRHVMEQISNQADRELLSGITEDLNILLAQYIRALVLLGLAASISYGIFFEIIGVPYALLLAAIAFPLEFIPMLGPATSATIILIVAGLGGFHNWIVLVAFLGIYRIIQDYVLAPHLMSKGTELHPLLVIFGVFAGEQIGGVAGAFLSVPIMAVLRMIYWRLDGSRIRKEIAEPEVVEVPK